MLTTLGRNRSYWQFPALLTIGLAWLDKILCELLLKVLINTFIKYLKVLIRTFKNNSSFYKYFLSNFNLCQMPTQWKYVNFSLDYVIFDSTLVSTLEEGVWDGM